MSTIAYRAGVMAGDSKISAGSLNTFGFMNKVKKVDGFLLGGTGNIELVAWFFKNFKPSWVTRKTWSDDSRVASGKDDEFEALVITPNRKVILIEEKMIPIEIGTIGYVAIGSGSPVAMGAMFAGADAPQAVAAAIRHDEGTGGKVSKISLAS